MRILSSVRFDLVQSGEILFSCILKLKWELGKIQSPQQPKLEDRAGMFLKDVLP